MTQSLGGKLRKLEIIVENAPAPIAASSTKIPTCIGAKLRMESPNSTCARLPRERLCAYFTSNVVLTIAVISFS